MVWVQCIRKTTDKKEIIDERALLEIRHIRHRRLGDRLLCSHRRTENNSTESGPTNCQPSASGPARCNPSSHGIRLQRNTRRLELRPERAPERLRLSQFGTGTFEIKFTSHEAMVESEEAFFDDVLSFFEAERFVVNRHLHVKDDVHNAHFRKGLTDEWKKIVSREERKDLANLIDAEAAEFFGWSTTDA